MSVFAWILILLVELAALAGLLWLVKKVSMVQERFKNLRVEWLEKALDSRARLKAVNQMLRMVESSWVLPIAPKSWVGKLLFWAGKFMMRPKPHLGNSLKSDFNFHTLKS